MGDPQAVGRNTLTWSIIEGGFGIGWIEWGIANQSATAWIAARVLGAVIGLVIIARAIRLRRAPSANPGPAEPSMFAALGYRLVVAAEVLALVAGSIVLLLANRAEFQIVWVAFVVGVHFVIFGRLFAARFYSLGLGLLVAALAGLLVGIGGAGTGPTQALTGLIAGACMFAMAARMLLRYRLQPA